MALLPPLAAGVARAAEPPLSLAETLKIAVARSQQLVSQRAMADAAREMVVPAGELPDPKLKAGVENVPTRRRGRLVADARLHDDVEDRPDAGISARGKAAAEGRSAPNATPSAAPRRRSRRRSRSSATPATAWVARRFAEDAERAIAAQIGEAELNATTVAAAYRAGKAPQSELIAAQSMVVDLRNRATEAATQAKRARIMLARYVGPAAERPLGDAPDFTRLPEAARLARRRRAAGVEARRAQESIAAAEAAIAGAAKRPDWSAEISYAFRGSPYSNMVSLMFSIDLPWSAGTRQDREHAAKLRELDAARAMREDTQRMRTAEVEQMVAEWESARRAGATHRKRADSARRAAPRRGAGRLSRRHRSALRGARRAPRASSTPSSRSSPNGRPPRKRGPGSISSIPAVEGS